MKVTLEFNVMNADLSQGQIREFLEEGACKVTDFAKEENIDIVDLVIHDIEE